jgi:hypothetical protein
MNKVIGSVSQTFSQILFTTHYHLCLARGDRD